MTNLIGHQKLISTLKDLAGRDALHHSYLFVGPASTGKRTVAESLANFLETKEFAPIQRVLNDCLVIAPSESNSIGIDEVRRAKLFLFERPNTSLRRTLIIDRAETLTLEAQNALLKISEEPPVSALIILIVTDAEVLLPTLRSRFHELLFGYVPEKDIATWLKEIHRYSSNEAGEFAKRALGAPGRALALNQDENLKAYLKSAEAFLRIIPSQSKQFLKDLVEPDDFSFPAFLDALILNLAYSLSSRSFLLASPFWHSLLELRGRLEYANLNPRIQLEYLLQRRVLN